MTFRVVFIEGDWDDYYELQIFKRYKDCFNIPHRDFCAIHTMSKYEILKCNFKNKEELLFELKESFLKKRSNKRKERLLNKLTL